MLQQAGPFAAETIFETLPMHANEPLMTFAIAAAIGVMLFSLAHHLKTSAIVVLLAGGILAGPSGIGLVQPDTLGEALTTIISLSVAIILFEGGLTLDIKEYRSASRVIIRILTAGVLITWLGTATAIKLVFSFDWSFCLLAASLVIVTGPTVIGPLLHRIRARAKVQTILHWEGVLIDPIGVFIALLCFEYYVSANAADTWALQAFILRFAVGSLIGLAFGFFLDFVLRNGWIEDRQVNIFVLAMAMLNFAVADMLISESGLLSVTIGGLVLGVRSTPQLREIVSYKSELKDFLIGLLFILLAANLDLSAFFDAGWRLVIVVAIVMLVVRPVNVLLSTLGTQLSFNEKLFLSWISPRGIVAASMASVVALSLKEFSATESQFIETFTFSVIAGTVVIQGFSAGFVGKLLGVVRPDPNGWIVVGAHAIGRQVSQFLVRHQQQVVLIDTNALEVRAAEREGLTALNEDAMSLNPDEFPSLYSCGNLIAFTANPDLNRMLCRRWSEILEGNFILRWERSGYQTDENQHLLSGDRIWENFPLDRWMRPYSEPAPVRIQPGDVPPPPIKENVLMIARNKSLIETAPADIQENDAEWMVFDRQKSQQSVQLPLEPENVLFSECEDLKALYLEMLQHLESQLPKLDPLLMLESMWEREEDYTSLLGNGIALPHAWSPDIQQTKLVVARPVHNVQCPLTNRSIEIVFMLLSPEGNANEHLAHLSFIARLIGSQSQREHILQAVDATDLFHRIAMS